MSTAGVHLSNNQKVTGARSAILILLLCRHHLIKNEVKSQIGIQSVPSLRFLPSDVAALSFRAQVYLRKGSFSAV